MPVASCVASTRHDEVGGAGGDGGADGDGGGTDGDGSSGARTPQSWQSSP